MKTSTYMWERRVTSRHGSRAADPVRYQCLGRLRPRRPRQRASARLSPMWRSRGSSPRDLARTARPVSGYRTRRSGSGDGGITHLYLSRLTVWPRAASGQGGCGSLSGSVRPRAQRREGPPHAASCPAPVLLSSFVPSSTRSAPLVGSTRAQQRLLRQGFSPTVGDARVGEHNVAGLRACEVHTISIRGLRISFQGYAGI